MSFTTRDGVVATPQGQLWARMLQPVHEAGLPVVIVHGGPGFPSHYLEPLSALADERAVVFYDQIGAGRSQPAVDETAWTVEGYVERLELVRAHFELPRVHLFGHSWGGFLALSYADTHPDRIASLILASPLIDSDLWMRDCRELIARLPAEHRRALAAGTDAPGYREGEAEFNRRHVCRIEPWPAPLQQAAAGQDRAAYEAMWGPNEFTNTGSLRGMSRQDAVARLKVPTLWMCGSDDEARPATLRMFASRSPRSRFVELPGTHNVHLEHPVEYVSAVRTFLRDTDTAHRENPVVRKDNLL